MRASAFPAEDPMNLQDPGRPDAPLPLPDGVGQSRGKTGQTFVAQPK